MKPAVILFVILLMMYSDFSFAQDIKEFQWKNRLLIISIDSIDNDKYIGQMHSLNSDLEGLELRKLLIITLVSGDQSMGLSNKTRQAISPSYKEFIDDERPFMFYLIGLDGGVKFSSSEIVSNHELFKIIDVMPMRRNEIDNNN